MLSSDLLANRMQDKATERSRTNGTSSEGNAVLRRVTSKSPKCFRRLHPTPLPFQKLWVDGEGDESKEKYLHKIKDKKRGEKEINY